jgi:uncharacterized protein (DUF58 family)
MTDMSVPSPKEDDEDNSNEDKDHAKRDQVYRPPMGAGFKLPDVSPAMLEKRKQSTGVSTDSRATHEDQPMVETIDQLKTHFAQQLADLRAYVESELEQERLHRIRLEDEIKKLKRGK